MGRRFINARGETAGTTRSFRDAFAHRRCLVPADGFFEWRKDERSAKEPFWFHSASGGVLALAGIWERWTPPPWRTLPRLRRPHDQIASLVVPAPAGALLCHAFSSRVNGTSPDAPAWSRRCSRRSSVSRVSWP